MKYDYNGLKDIKIISKVVDGITSESIEKMLGSTSFEDFCDACDIISYATAETATEHIALKSMQALANSIVREHLGNLAKIYDLIIRKSGQELRNGDELYCLFNSHPTPSYVTTCIISMLYVNEYMKKGIKTIEDCIAVSDYIYHPPYMSIYRISVTGNPYEIGAKIDKERNAWHKITELLFNGDFDSAYKFIESERED